MDTHVFKYDDSFELESGVTLPRFQLEYATMGVLNEKRDNVIWVCHALTANAYANDWWDGLIGKGMMYDPDHHFIICANMLGSCYGSSGPIDTNPETKRMYGIDFPTYTVRDVVGTLDLLRKHLEFDKIHTLIGGSMGGMQAIEWAITHPDVADNLILLATNAKHSPWGIAFNESQRMAIEADPTWREYRKDAGQNGLRAARSMALISYRNYEAYWNTQSETDIEKLDRYKAQSYQQYQGDKLVRRFNCHSYYLLSKAMDSHHVGRGRGGIEKALIKVTSNTLVIGVSSDLLFPTSEQRTLAENIPGATYQEIDSFYGHDGFLIETKAITQHIKEFYESKNVKFA